jgi:hypothetical protein
MVGAANRISWIFLLRCISPDVELPGASRLERFCKLRGEGCATTEGLGELQQVKCDEAALGACRAKFYAICCTD